MIFGCFFVSGVRGAGVCLPDDPWRFLFRASMSQSAASRLALGDRGPHSPPGLGPAGVNLFMHV